MRLLEHKLQTVPTVVTYLNNLVTKEAISFEMISEAPLWLRLISRGQYCGYKKSIYVPPFHLEMIASKHDTDKTLATAKMLPWVMCFHDSNENISAWKAFKMLFSVRHQIHYTLYELLFLKATNNKFYELVTVGFMTTRKSLWSIRKMPYEKVEHFVTSILEANKPT